MAIRIAAGEEYIEPHDRFIYLNLRSPRESLDIHYPPLHPRHLQINSALTSVEPDLGDAARRGACQEGEQAGALPAEGLGLRAPKGWGRDEAQGWGRDGAEPEKRIKRELVDERYISQRYTIKPSPARTQLVGVVI